MKIFISADIEGVTGVTHWNETELGHAEYQAFREQMTAEVSAACEGALQAGVQEIWIKDSHDTGRNLVAAKLPRQAHLIRGWSGHPMMMLQELDSSFQAVLLVGYHSGSGAGASPLEHTMSTDVTSILVNGQPISEFMIDLYNCAYHGVPLVFVAGDNGLCESVKQLNPHITTVAVKECKGDSTINLHPQVAAERIRESSAQALQGDLQACRVELPAHFKVEVAYHSQAKAYRFGFFPGARQTGPLTVQFETHDYFDVLRFFLFAL